MSNIIMLSIWPNILHSMGKGVSVQTMQQDSRSKVRRKEILSQYCFLLDPSYKANK